MYQAQFIFDYIKTKYDILPVYLWQKYPSYAVFRHQHGKKKWFALIGEITQEKLGINEAGKTYFMNIKCQPDVVSILLQTHEALPAYHMNKKHWLTIVINHHMNPDELFKLINRSYELTH